jgi:hypothetical protein
MNQNMTNLLAQMQIDPVDVDIECVGPGPALITAGDSIFLKDEFAQSRHHSVEDFADTNALESFVNHVHFPFRNDRQSLAEAIAYSACLRQSLGEFSSEKKFVIIVCISDTRCTVRFHQIRRNESWLCDDLDGYREEAVMVLNT